MKKQTFWSRGNGERDLSVETGVTSDLPHLAISKSRRKRKFLQSLDTRSRWFLPEPGMHVGRANDYRFRQNAQAVQSVGVNFGVSVSRGQEVVSWGKHTNSLQVPCHIYLVE